MEIEERSKAAILGRIRAAIRPAGKALADDAGAGAAWASIVREYRSEGAGNRAEVLEKLIDRLRDYDAQVVVCAPERVTDNVAAMLAKRGVRRLVVPEGMPAEAMPAGFEFVVDAGSSASELDAFDGVVTLCTVGIAETGTLVLQRVPGQGRRALSLVPDYHLCVVDVADVVATVPEGMARLAATAGLATTFISGPSATADIEMTRIKGVHGPRSLDVLLVTDGRG
jgi:L-lactate dehydrogenase complex protein LldG